MIDRLIKEIRGRRRWLLASHLNPDGDAIGSLLGLGLLLEDMGKEVTMLNASGVPAAFAFLPASDRVVEAIEDPAAFDGLIIMDSGEASRIGPLADRVAEFPLVVNLDHHPSRKDWGEVRWVDTTYAAVGEMIHHLAPLLPARISAAAATSLYAAIMTDTGSFRYTNTTPRTLLAALELVELGADPALIAKRVYLTYSPGRLKLLGEVLASLEILAEGRVGLLTVDQATLARTGTDVSSLDGFIDYARGIESIEVAAMLCEEKGGYKLSLRSAGQADVAALAGRFGGGGHKMAAGGFIEGGLDEARRKFLAAAREALDG